MSLLQSSQLLWLIMLALTCKCYAGPLAASGPLGAGLSLPSAGYPGAGINDPLRQTGKPGLLHRHSAGLT